MVREETVARRNNTIDLIRFIAVAFIVYLHVWQLPSVKETEINILPVIIARLGVPMFFAISGYLLFSDDRKKTRTRAAKAILSLSTIFLGAVTLYAPVYLVLNKTIFTGARDIFDLFVFNLVHFSAGPLWFLVSLIYVNVIFWTVLTFFKNENWLAGVSMVILAMLLFLIPYGTVNGINTEVTQYYLGKGWLFALPFFALGYFIHKFHDRYLVNIELMDLIKVAVLVLIAYTGEYILLSSYSPVELGPVNYEIYVFMVPLVACILLLALRFNELENNLISQLGRRYSLYIYIIHSAVILAAVRVLEGVGVNYFSSDRRVLGFFLCVLIGSLALSMAYQHVRQNSYARNSKKY